MTYELAKKLKDEGLFQSGRGSYITSADIESSYPPAERMESYCAYIPTLSELIEACGKYDLIGVRNYKDFTEDGKIKWFAYDDLNKCYGETPEEAVAKLWLELHKNA